MVFQEIFQFGRAVNAGNLGKRNLNRIRRRRRDLRGNPRRGENEQNPEDRVPDERAHLRCLYIASTVPSRKYKVVQVFFRAVGWRRGVAKASARLLRRRWKNFIAPRKRRRFPEHGRNRAVLVFAELDSVLYRGVVELATETIEHFKLGPDRGRLRRTFARTNHFQRIELLSFFLQDDDYVGGGAGAQRVVRRTVGIDGERVSGRARGQELLFANPLHGSSLHAVPREKA